LIAAALIAYSQKESTVNWNASSGDGKCTVPLIFQISQILKIGKPISIEIGGKCFLVVNGTSSVK
jgi:hypothetical protein